MMYMFIIKYLDGSTKRLVGKTFTYTPNVVNVIKYPVHLENAQEPNFWND